MTKSTIAGEKRDRMQARQVRGKTSEGYNSYLETGGVRFNGKASHSGDRGLIEEARRTTEPNWAMLTLEQLQAAEKMARHKLSGGEASWQPVLDRIRKALREAERAARAR